MGPPAVKSSSEHEEESCKARCGQASALQEGVPVAVRGDLWDCWVEQ